MPRREVPPLIGAARLRRLGLRHDSGGGDFTVHVVVGIDPDDRPWLLDIWRERATTDLWIEAWCRLVKHYSPLSWAEERGQILTGVGPYLERRARELHAFTDRQQFTSQVRQGRSARNRWRGYIATMGLWYADDAGWREMFEHELLTFPAGRHDDIVDALGLCRAAARLRAARHAAEEREQEARARLQGDGARSRPSYRSWDCEL